MDGFGPLNNAMQAANRDSDNMWSSYMRSPMAQQDWNRYHQRTQTPWERTAGYQQGLQLNNYASFGPQMQSAMSQMWAANNANADRAQRQQALGMLGSMLNRMGNFSGSWNGNGGSGQFRFGDTQSRQAGGF